MRATAKSSKTLPFGYVVVWVACAFMKGSSRESHAGSKGVKFPKAIRSQVEPAATIFPNFGIVYVYQVVSCWALEGNVTRLLLGKQFALRPLGTGKR